MSLFNQYQTILKEAHLTSFKSKNKLNEADDLDVTKKLHRLISTKELENIELAWQLAKGQNETAAFEKILYHTFVPNALQEQFEQDVQPIKAFLNKPLIEILSDESFVKGTESELYKLGQTLDNKRNSNVAIYRDYFLNEIYDKLGADTEYDNVLSKIDNDLDALSTAYSRYVGGSNGLDDQLKEAKRAYNFFKNY